MVVASLMGNSNTINIINNNNNTNQILEVEVANFEHHHPYKQLRHLCPRTMHPQRPLLLGSNASATPVATLASADERSNADKETELQIAMQATHTLHTTITYTSSLEPATVDSDTLQGAGSHLLLKSQWNGMFWYILTGI